MHAVASALSVLVTHRTLLCFERVDIGVGGVSRHTRGDLIAHDIPLALDVPYAFMIFPRVIRFRSVARGLAGCAVFGELIGAVHRDTMNDSAVAPLHGMIGIGGVKTEIRCIAGNTDTGYTGRFVLVFGTIENPVIEMNSVIVAHHSLSGIYRLCIDIINVQVKLVYRVTSVDGM